MTSHSLHRYPCRLDRLAAVAAAAAAAAVTYFDDNDGSAEIAGLDVA